MQNTNLTKSAKRQRFFLRLKQQWTLQAFALLGIAFLIIFSYIPMVGIVLAFRPTSPNWVWLAFLPVNGWALSGSRSF